MLNKKVEKHVFPNNEYFLNEIRNIGNNIMDLYVGQLSANVIISEIFDKLVKENIFDKNKFEDYLSNNGYKIIEISDKSKWILRSGNKENAYIHIHPSRSGENTLRITGSAWKTAITLALFNETIMEHLNLLEKVNFVRTRYLGLSPVKKIISGSSLDKSLELFDIPKQ